MEVGQGPNWGCSAKEKKNNRLEEISFHLTKVKREFL
jgi:hypothetical protein